jgi:hypothetical protein
MRLKGHDCGRQSHLPRLIDDGLQQSGMTAMHAIKVANGQGTRTARFRVGEATKDMHNPNILSNR